MPLRTTQHITTSKEIPDTFAEYERLRKVLEQLTDDNKELKNTLTRFQNLENCRQVKPSLKDSYSDNNSYQVFHLLIVALLAFFAGTFVAMNQLTENSMITKNYQ